MGKKIIIDTPGIILRVQNGLLTFPVGNKLARERFEEIDELRIGPGVMLSSDVLLNAVDAKTMVLIADTRGNLAGIFLPATYTGTVKTQREQIRAYDDWRGVTLAKAFAKASIITRAKLLDYLGKNRRDKPEGEKLEKTAKEIMEISHKIDEIEGQIDDIRQNLMSIEAKAADKYFQALQLVIPEKYGFKGKRTRRPPKDPFNATISFINNRIREIALQAVITAGLHPYFGFLHADKPGRFSMALDLAEEFIVPVGHIVAIKLFVREMLKENHFRHENEAVFLNWEGRSKVLAELENRLAKQIHFKGVKTTIRNAIHRQARHLAAYLRGEERNYEIAQIPL